MTTSRKKNLRKIVVIAMLLGVAGESSAQWGTTTPTTILASGYTGVQGSSAIGGALQITTTSLIGSVPAYLQVGPQNSTYCHFMTNASYFYFNTTLSLGNGTITSYENNNLTFEIGNNGGPGGTPKMTISGSTSPNPGYVGIGTTSPAEKLDVSGADANGTVAIFRGNVTVNPSNPAYGFVMGSASSAALNYGTSYSGYNAIRSSSGTWTFNSDGAHNGGDAIFGDVNGNLHFSAIASSSSGTTAQTLSDAQVYSNNDMMFTYTGQLVIGNNLISTMNIPGSYGLYVGNGILATLVKVASISGGNWSDYVFANDYRLKSLHEVAQYIKDNKHLPDVPSAADVEKDGIDLAKMDATLLKKVEELTLYIIQQDKKIDELEKKVNASTNEHK